MMPAVSASSIVNGATLNVRGLAMGESFSTVTTTALSVPSAAVKSASWNLSWTTVKGGKRRSDMLFCHYDSCFASNSDSDPCQRC